MPMGFSTAQYHNVAGCAKMTLFLRYPSTSRLIYFCVVSWWALLPQVSHSLDGRHHHYHPRLLPPLSCWHILMMWFAFFGAHLIWAFFKHIWIPTHEPLMPRWIFTKLKHLLCPALLQPGLAISGFAMLYSCLAWLFLSSTGDLHEVSSLLFRFAVKRLLGSSPQ